MEIVSGGFFDSRLRVPQQSVQEDRPAFLEECKENLSVRNQCLKGPIIEYAALAQELNKPLVQHSRDALVAVVTAE